MIRIFKTRIFHRWTKKERVINAQLCDAVQEIQAGLIDADLGRCLIKKRIARSGQGKRGGHRAVIAFKKNERIIFIYGFSKSDRENTDKAEVETYKILADHYLSLSEFLLDKMVSEMKLIEVCYEESGEKDG